MPLPPAKKQKTLACIREIQVDKLWTKVYSQTGLTAMVSWRVVCAPNIITCHWYYIICTLQFHFSSRFSSLPVIPCSTVFVFSSWRYFCPQHQFPRHKHLPLHIPIEIHVHTWQSPHHPIKGNNSSSLHMDEGTWLLGQHVNFGCREFFFLLLFFLFLLFVVVVAYYTAMPFSRTGGQISCRLIFI